MPIDQNSIGPAIERAGYTYVSGWGPSAIWQKQAVDKNGKPIKGQFDTYSEYEIAKSMFGSQSPYDQPTASLTAAGTGGNAPDLSYDAEGHAFVWQNGQPVPMPQFDRGDKAVGYRAQPGGGGAAPLAPHIQVQPNGDVYRIDPYTGQPTLAGNIGASANLSTFTGYDGKLWTFNPQTGQSQPTQVQVAYSQEDLRSQQLADAQAGRNFTADQNQQDRSFRTSERVAGEGFAAGESQKSRDFTAGESAIDRAIRAAEFAAQQDAQERGLQFQVANANAQGQERAAEVRRGAAKDYASLVSSTDTAALPAYLMAGGGNYFNAPAGGAQSLLTDNAIAPAADSLRTAETYRWSPITLPAYQGFQRPTMPAAQPTPQPVPQQPAPAAVTAQPAVANPFAGFQAIAQQQQAAGLTPAVQAPGFANGTQGFIRAPQQGFVTGEVAPEYQQVIDPPGPDNAMIRVTPVQGFARGTPQYALGTTADPAGLGLSDGLQPYAERVREFRTGLTPLDVGFSQFDPRFSRQRGQTVRSAYFNREQTRLGIPADELAFEAQRFTPRGFNRGAVSMGY